MTHEHYLRRLMAVRRAGHMRRASACAFVPERVQGIALRPITPATWSLLVGIGSALVSGGPAEESDVRNFVLFHLPEFDADRPRAGAWVRFLMRWRLERALVPLRTPRVLRPMVRAENLRRAIAQCRAIIDDTFADTPMPGERDVFQTPEFAAALEPQFVHLFASRYSQWPLPTPIRHTPLRILTQLARCVDRAAYFDPAEAALDSEYLRSLNEPQPQTQP